MSCLSPDDCEAKTPDRLCRRCSLVRLNADPSFKVAHAQRAREWMKNLHADPEFKAAHAERARERMKNLHADPEFKAANAERMKRLNADPEFKAAHVVRWRERMKRRHAEKMAWLPAAWREEYARLRTIVGAASARRMVEEAIAHGVAPIEEAAE